MELRRLLLAACCGIALAQDSTSSSVSSGSSSSGSSSESGSTSASTSASDSSSNTRSGSSSSDSSSSTNSDSSSQSTETTTTQDSSSTSASRTSSRSSSRTSSRPHASSVTASFSVGIPSVNGNPFLEASNLPEGTLFIACGSILLGIFLAVAAWRVTEIYSHRKATQLTQEKYQELNDESAQMHRVDADYDLSIPGKFNAAPQLFFSPTANVMQNGSIGPMVSAHSNTYLPAGYYNSHRGGGDKSGSGDVPDSSSPSLAPSANSSHVHLPPASQRPSAPRVHQRPPSEFLNDLLSH